MAERKAEEPATPLYWYLICSGYRTYLYLPLFYRQFYPRYDQPTPELEQRLLDALGRCKLGQLGAVEAVTVRGAEERYLDACAALGQRAGDVKPSYLRRDLGWRQHLSRPR